MLTSEELEVVRRLADAAVAFVALPVCHSHDRAEFTAGVHALQNMVMARSAVRDDPDFFTHDEGFR